MDAQLITKDTGVDRRSVVLNLTALGQEAIEQASSQRQAVLERLLKRLSATEQQQLEQLAIKILWHETRDATHALQLCRLCNEAQCVGTGCPVDCKEHGQAMPS